MTNFHTRLAAAATRFGDRPAVEMVTASGVVTTTYADLMGMAAAIAQGLADDADIRPGDRVALLGANSASWVAAYLGVLRLGAVAIPLDTAYTAAQIRTVLVDADARVLLAGTREWSAATAAAEGLVPGVRVAPLGGPAAGARPMTGRSEAPPVAAVTGESPAAMLYTSGTTADPKGVVLTHANLEAERAGALAVIHVDETDAVLGVLPLFHALAQMANLLLPLSAGSRVVFLETIDSGSLLGALQTRGITVFACVPQFFYLIHQRVLERVAARGRVARRVFRGLMAFNHHLRNRTGLNAGPRLFGAVHAAFGPRMRLLITGGSRFDPAIARDLHGLGLTLLNGYGLTETSGAATVMRPGDRFTTSVGQPLPGVEVTIQPRPATGGDTTAASRADSGGPTDGEILIRGGVVMREYFKRPDATAEAVRNGWLHTGDLGYVDAEGRVFITGRLKEIIVLSSGKNLYPEEIESHYRQSAFIKELCVVGVSRPDEPASERLHAVVVPDADVLRAKGIVNLRELIRFEMETLSVRLPAHKRVLTYDIQQDPLPRTTTGKLKRGDISRHAPASPAPADGQPDATGDAAWIAAGDHGAWLDAVAARLDRPRVSPAAHLELDLGLDSMERVELLASLEDRAGRRVAPDTRATIFTVRQLIEAVTSAAAAGEARAPDLAADRATDRIQAPDEWHRLLGLPADPSVMQDLGRPSAVRAWVIGAVLRGVVLVARLVLRIRVEGRQHLPTTGPYLLCPNHQSHLDGFLLAATLPIATLRQTFFVGASEYFETPTTARAARLLNIVPVDPDANLIGAMRTAAAGLRLGKILILFPEGERTIDGRVRPFRKGATILGATLQVPVVPVGIDGLFPLWPRGRGVQWRTLRPWHRLPVTLRFGAPVQVSSGDPADTARHLEHQVRMLLAP